MNLLSVENISRSYGERVLFRELGFGLSKGQKTALIARNGTGKTSLMKILSGDETPESGQVIWRKGIRVAYLPQDPDFDHEMTVWDTVFESDDPALQAIKDYEWAIAHEAGADDLQARFDEVEALEAWDREVKIKEILDKLGITDLDQKVGTLSGGQKKRVALAHLLIDLPDVIILDEPTNHLDLEMVEWLERFLSDPTLTIFMVTHDRYFLDRVCNEILELDGGILHKYKGNYSYFLEKRSERYEQREANVMRARNLYRKELDWMRRQPKARGTKAKARIDAFHDLSETASTRLREDEMKMDFNIHRLGSKIVEFHKVNKSFGDKQVLNRFSYTFKRKERIGIVGQNGSGKSTFLRMLTGELMPDGGKIVIGETVVFGFYKQEGIHFKEGQKVIDAIKSIAEVIPLTKGRKITAAQLLERFLFDRKQHHQLISKLSGGERKRLYLLTILMRNPNFLILDEPTNDLDVLTLQVLEDFLEDFPGCLITVSHDRYFINKLVDHLFIFQSGGQVKDFNGNYSDYQEFLKAERKKVREQEQAKSTPRKKTGPKEGGRLSYMEQREFDQLEGEIEQLEGRKEEIGQSFANDPKPEEIKSLSLEMNEILEQIEEKTMRWMELAEKQS
jgi:ATP-binding cassette subfamily F protein uup